MAGKVNYRFVALLGVVLVACTLGLVGLWYFFVRTVPSEAIARGEGFLEQGQYARAADQFGKALAKRPNDVPLLLRYASSIAPIKVGDIRAARDTVARLKATYEKVLQLDPVQADALDRLMQLYMSIGRDLGDLQVWDQMLSAANTALDVDSELVAARQYRGIAQVNRMAVLDVSAEQRAQAKEDLNAAAKAMPDGLEAKRYLVRWHLIEARRLARDGALPEQVSGRQRQALELSQQLIADDPNDPARKLYHLRALAALGKQEQQHQLLLQLEKQMLARPVPADVALAVSNRLAFAGTRQRDSIDNAALVRSEAILRAAMGAHRHDLRFHSALGRVLSLQDRDDEALATLKAACDVSIEATAVAMLRDATLQSRMLTQYADMLLARAEKQQGGSHEAVLLQVEQVVSRIETTSGQIPVVSLLKGKLDMARKQWTAAIDKIDHASALYEDTNVEALRLSATIRIELGEPGAAIDRLAKLVQLRSDHLSARHELMRLHLQLGQYEQLRQQIDATLAVSPGDFEARRFEALMLARRGNTQEAIAAIGQLDPDKHPKLTPALARLYIAQGDRQQAAKLLKTECCG